MASLIDFTKPEAGKASTQDVRTNFEAAANEIGELQQIAVGYVCKGDAEDADNIAAIIDKFYRDNQANTKDRISLRLAISGKLTSSIAPVAQNTRNNPIFLDFRNCELPNSQTWIVLNSNRGNHIFYIEGLKANKTTINSTVVYCRGTLHLKDCTLWGVASALGGLTATNCTIWGSIGAAKNRPVTLRDCACPGVGSISGGTLVLENITSQKNIVGGPIILRNVACAAVYVRNYSRCWIRDSTATHVSVFRCGLDIENTIINSGASYGIFARGTSQRQVRLVNVTINTGSTHSIFTRQVLVMERCRIYGQYGVFATNTIRINHSRIQSYHTTVGTAPGLLIGSAAQGYGYHPVIVTNSFIRSNGAAVAIREFRTGMIRFSGCILIGNGISPIPADDREGRGPYAIRVNAANTGVGVVVENCYLKNTRTAGLTTDPCIYQQALASSIKWHLMGNRYNGNVININQSPQVDYYPFSYSVYMPQYANLSGQVIEGEWEEYLQQ